MIWRQKALICDVTGPSRHRPGRPGKPTAPGQELASETPSWWGGPMTLARRVPALLPVLAEAISSGATPIPQRGRWCAV